MGLKGYTFDRMKISPKADALLYHSMLDGNDRIVKGYKDELKVVATGLNTYISPGACVVQGRMIEIDEEMQLSVPANDSGYICIVIDLTQNNTSAGEAGTPDYQPVNNQLRLEVVKELVQQDLHDRGQLYTFPFASFTSTGTTVNLTKVDHNQRIVESGSNINGKFLKFADGTLICYQRIKLGKSEYGAGTFNNPYRTETKDWTFPTPFVDNNLILNMQQLSISSDSSQRLGSCSNSNIYNNKVTQIQFACNSATAFTHDILVNLIAIGRWKA